MCREVIEFLMDYLDEGLDPKVRGEFELHLSRCKDCVKFLHTYRATISLGRTACETCKDEDSPPIPEGLVRAILKARLAGDSGGQSPKSE